jgi:heme-degrading monooxygenase HmoA
MRDATPVLLRLYSYRLAAGHEADFETYVRDHSIEAVRQLAGVARAWFGRHEAEGETRFVAVTCWHDYDSMVAAVGRDLNRPIFAPNQAGYEVAGSAQHFENIDEPPVGSGGEATVLRLLRGRIARGREEEVYASIRQEGWPLLGRLKGLADARIGRQSSADGDVILHVTVWRDRRAVERATRGKIDRPLMPLPPGSFTVESIDHFEILQSTAKLGSAA